MEIIYTELNNELRITLFGELDETCVQMARQSIDGTLNTSRYKKVVFDMSKLSFMDSTGIGLMVGRYKKFSKSLSFFIEFPSRTIDKLLKLSGIYTIMPKI